MIIENIWHNFPIKSIKSCLHRHFWFGCLVWHRCSLDVTSLSWKSWKTFLNDFLDGSPSRCNSLCQPRGYHENKETGCESGSQAMNVITWGDRSRGLSAHVNAVSLVGASEGKENILHGPQTVWNIPALIRFTENVFSLECCGDFFCLHSASTEFPSLQSCIGK